MFGIDTTIWTCKCCGFTMIVSSTNSKDEEYRCRNCNHVNYFVNQFTYTEEELAEHKKELDKLRDRRPG